MYVVKRSAESHDTRSWTLWFFIIISSMVLIMTNGCMMVGPDYVRPTVSTPGRYKGKVAETVTTSYLRSSWWEVFNDPDLNRFAEEFQQESLELQAAASRIDQAYAVLRGIRADKYPSISQTGGVDRRGVSDNDQGGPPRHSSFTQYRIGLELGWELDLWGRVRRLVEANAAEAEISVALYEDVKLLLLSQLARSYFSLRFLDEEKKVLSDAVETRREHLSLADSRFKGGKTSELDVARAETELASTEAELARLDAPRVRFENAIAVLLGKDASTFHIESRLYRNELPSIPVNLPMEIIEQRPDVAAAEHALAASNARIGIATAEFFPKITLLSSGGFSSINSGDFLGWSSRTFRFGPDLSLPIFQGGRLRANLERAQAAHDEALANFQQVVLESFRDIEDALATLSALQAEIAAQKKAVEAAEKALHLSKVRYEAGGVSYIEVVDSQRERLTAKRRAVQIRGQQFEATVRLIQALGGGYKGAH